MSGNSVCEQDELCSAKPSQDDGGRELIDKLTRSEGNDMCADCGEISKFIIIITNN